MKLPQQTLEHTYYVDSTPKVADAWFYSSDTDTTKEASEWKTVLVCGLRKGGKHYFALDITNTSSPKYLWQFPHPGDPAITSYSSFLNALGQSWSEPAIGKVKIDQGSGPIERWVAFIGGGFDDSPFNNGKIFYVINLKTGEIIKEFKGLDGMTYPVAAPPTAVDTNSDGYIDRVYIGDLAGQMWVFNVSSTSVSDWNGKRLFTPDDLTHHSIKHPIYYQPAVVFDGYRTPWVFFGTGDRENPLNMTSQEKFYAVKDDGLGDYPRGEGLLQDVTSNNTYTQSQDPSIKGWYISLTTAEKVLAKPAVFNRLVYFTTYTSKTAGADPCKVAGDAKLYIVEYLSGGGATQFSEQNYLQGIVSSRSEAIGSGVPSPAVISFDSKGNATVTVGTTGDQFFSKSAFSPSIKEILNWREVIR